MKDNISESVKEIFSSNKPLKEKLWHAFFYTWNRIIQSRNEIEKKKAGTTTKDIKERNLGIKTDHKIDLGIDAPTSHQQFSSERKKLDEKSTS